MEQYLHLFAISGVVLAFLGFVSYNQGTGQINTATWLMWVIGDGLEAGSYFVMTGEDLLKNAVPIAFAIGSFLTFVFALVRGRFSLPDWIDNGVIVIDLGITISWWQQHLNAVAANISFVVTELISFIPMYRGILAGREHERILPWVLWAAADALFLCVVLSLPNTWEEKIYPAVQMIAHFGVVICILRWKVKQWTPA